MPSNHAPRPSRLAPLATSVKIVVAGGFGVGKTTFVGTVSEIEPITTEAAMTDAATGVDDQFGVEDKITTTVALDFGRITIDETLIVYLFGTPGQDRFAFLWDELAIGAVGAVVLVDTRRIDNCYSAIEFFERRATPFVVAVNAFDGAQRYDLDEVREALDLANDVPMVDCDARSRADVKVCLASLLEYVISHYQPTGAPPNGLALS